MPRNLLMFAVMAEIALRSVTASAHAHLQTAAPPVGSTVVTAPTQVTITFSEPVELHFSTVSVRDASGARLDDGPLRAADGEGNRLVIGLKPLPPGEYHVEWHVTSVDTHKTEGAFVFTVAP